jgi:hypothetical protein
MARGAFNSGLTVYDVELSISFNSAFKRSGPALSGYGGPQGQHESETDSQELYRDSAKLDVLP